MSSENIIENDEYGIRDEQLYLLSILKDIDILCRENNIKYSLCAGSLLGAIRHKGFIPWDDDADIMFDRDNYNRFMDVASRYLPKEYMIIGDFWVKRITRKDNPNKDNDEACIDLFIMDNIPDNGFVASIKDWSIRLLQGMLKAKRKIEYDKYSFKDKILVYGTHILGKPFSINSKQKMYSKVSQWGNKNDSKYMNVYNSLFRYIGHRKYPSSIMRNYRNCTFENIELMIISDYDTYLRENYGDYLKLPPENERRPVHIKKA